MRMPTEALETVFAMDSSCLSRTKLVVTECCVAVHADTRHRAGICLALLALSCKLSVDYREDLALPRVCSAPLEVPSPDLLQVDGALSDIQLSSLQALELIARKGYVTAI